MVTINNRTLETRTHLAEHIERTAVQTLVLILLSESLELRNELRIKRNRRDMS